MKGCISILGLVVLALALCSPPTSACEPGMRRACPGGAGCQPVTPGATSQLASADSSAEARDAWGLPISVTGVSSYNNECRPSLTADGRILCFQTEGSNGPAYHPDHIAGVSFIYLAKWNGTEWDSLAPVDSAASAYGKYPFISSDGTKILFQRLGGNGDIYVTRWNGAHWTPAESIGDSINTDHFEGFPCLSFDGEDLYFASNRLGCIGTRDLWVSHRLGNSWSNPENLGPGVNTPNATNWNPFITADGQRLFFSREQYAHYTVHELWVSSWDGSQWGQAVNVGAPVNSCVQTCSCFLLPGTDKLFLGGEVNEGGFGGVQDIFCTGTGPPADAKDAEPDLSVWHATADMDSAWYVHCLLQAADGSIYAGTGPYGKVYRTIDGGDSWEKTGVLRHAMKVYGLAQTSGGVIYAGTYPHGDVYKTTTCGQSWTNCTDLFGATTVRGLWADADTVYAATFPSTDADLGFLYKTPDGGTTWNQLTPLPHVVGGVISVTLTSRQTLLCGCYADSSVIYRSADRGVGWTRAALPYAAGGGEPWSQVCFLEEVAPDTIYAGGWIHGSNRAAFVWKSTDDGASWDTTATRIVVNGVMATKAYGLARLDDGSLLVGFQPGPDSVVCRSPDDGATWEPLGSLGGAREVLSLLRASGGAVYAGTTPHGDVFKYASASAVDEGGPLPPRARALVSIVPNPSPRATTIAYRVPGPGRVTVRIHDVTGRLVRTLVDEDRRAGIYIVDWDGCDAAGRLVASGTYHAEFETASGASESTRIVLIR
jgi:photosystem II stability/assembly factor-like uncharacterized protein